MKFVKIEWDDRFNGELLDPSQYLAELPGFADRLPEGARRFATANGHYDFRSTRCIKDLRPISVSMEAVQDGTVDGVILLRGNPWKHNEDLTIRYAEVFDFSVAIDPSERNIDLDPGSGQFGDVRLDEVLPVDGGCSHEIETLCGRITILCRDLTINWTPTRGE